jgi:hypothetical protein
MSTVYRIEIDVRINNRMRTKVIQTARENYRKSPFAWTLENGQFVEISAEEFVVDTKTVGLRSRNSKGGHTTADAERRPVTSEVGFEPLVPASAAIWAFSRFSSRLMRDRSVFADCSFR